VTRFEIPATAHAQALAVMLKINFSMIKRLTILTLILFTTIRCSENNDSAKPENFIGQWTATEVIYDGTLRSEWTGAHLTFEQDKIDGGLYSMADTRYDSIWSSQGTWTKSNERFKIILDDTLTVDFIFENEKLIISKRLPWTAQSTCTDGICLPVVTGYWDFRFERDK
jgi:hypothetical protein